MKSYLTQLKHKVHKFTGHCQKESACPKHTGPKKLFRRIAQNNKPIKDIVFVLHKKKKKKKKRKVSHCSSGVGSAGVTGAASSVTSTMVVAFSIRFSAVA